MMGWFDTMPLFFMLLGLDLLLSKSRWGWPASAVAVALGFLVKLTPVLVVPIAIRWLGAKLSWQAARSEWFDRRSPGNLLRPAALHSHLFWRGRRAGLLAVQRQSGPRLQQLPHSEHPSAMAERLGADRRLLRLWPGAAGHAQPGRLRKLSVGEPYPLDAGSRLVFVGLYLWLYTRRYDWERIRTPIAFSAVSMIWLLLYSKGWSPQFLVWVLAFVVLLNPSMHTIAGRHRPQLAQRHRDLRLPDDLAGRTLDHGRHGDSAHGTANLVGD